MSESISVRPAMTYFGDWPVISVQEVTICLISFCFELHRLIGRGAWCEGGQPGQVTSRREPDEPDALRPRRPLAADLGAQRVQRRRVPDVERIAEHARLHADLAEPAGHRLGFVRSVRGITAARQDDHVGAGHLRKASTSAANSAWCWNRNPCAASG